ncbi:MAG TPA: hypothetical protein VH083_21245 [Myxococcales bacterium]|jgi:hypothetical protein|nr:hypothetical protein [Myxococcales bacterium]
MDALIQTVGRTVSQDMHELVQATHLEVQSLVELEPPNWHWGMPLGFASLAAAGVLLIAAAGVHETVEAQQHHHARRQTTKMHKRKLVAQHAPMQN